MKGGDWKINRSPSRLPASVRNQYMTVRLKALAALGACCKICGFADERALHIDHVNGNGSADRKKHSGMAFFYHVLKNVDSGIYQVLCANCNFIKRRVNEECLRTYNENYTFPLEPLHVKIYKEKKCRGCQASFVPTNGRQIYCSKMCVKG